MHCHNRDARGIGNGSPLVGMHDGVLSFPVPERSTIVDFADDLAVTITSKHPKGRAGLCEKNNENGKALATKS